MVYISDKYNCNTVIKTKIYRNIIKLKIYIYNKKNIICVLRNNVYPLYKDYITKKQYDEHDSCLSPHKGKCNIYFAREALTQLRKKQQLQHS